MSPEQARGRTVDRRTDIWAFGCIVFELLTGTPVFRGDTPSDTIAAVLEREPAWSDLPAGLPGPVIRLVRRCLEKNPDQRLHDIADARLEIDEALQSSQEKAPRSGAFDFAASGSKTSVTDARHAARWRGLAMRLLSLLLLLSGALALGWWARGVAAPRPSPAPLVRFTWSLPPGSSSARHRRFRPMAERLVFAASHNGSRSRLYVRALNEVNPTGHPWHRRGETALLVARQQLGRLLLAGRLMKVAIAGGAPVESARRESRTAARGAATAPSSSRRTSLAASRGCAPRVAPPRPPRCSTARTTRTRTGGRRSCPTASISSTSCVPCRPNDAACIWEVWMVRPRHRASTLPLRVRGAGRAPWRKAGLRRC